MPTFAKYWNRTCNLTQLRQWEFTSWFIRNQSKYSAGRKAFFTKFNLINDVSIVSFSCALLVLGVISIWNIFSNGKKDQQSLAGFSDLAISQWWRWPSKQSFQHLVDSAESLVCLLGWHCCSQRFHRKPPEPAPSAVWSQAQPNHPLRSSATTSRSRATPHDVSVRVFGCVNFYNNLLLYESVSLSTTTANSLYF